MKNSAIGSKLREVPVLQLTYEAIENETLFLQPKENECVENALVMALARVILGMVYFVYDYQRIIARLRLTIVKVGKENLSEESTLNSRKNLTKQLTLLLKAEKDRNELAANYSSKYVQL